MSNRGSSPNRSLGLTAELEVEVDGATATARTVGGRLVVETGSLRDAYRLVRAVDRMPSGPAALLDRTDLTTEVRVRGRAVAVVGPGASPGRISRALAPAGVELRPRGLLGRDDRTEP